MWNAEASDPNADPEELLELASYAPEAVLANPAMSLISLMDPMMWKRIWHRARMEMVRDFVIRAPESLNAASLREALRCASQLQFVQQCKEARKIFSEALISCARGSRSNDAFLRAGYVLENLAFRSSTTNRLSREEKFPIWQALADCISAQMPEPRQRFVFQPNRGR